MEQRLEDSEQLIATYQEIQKTHEKHRFMYWFLLKLACETVLNTEKSQEEKEDFAKEILTAFEEDFKKRGGITVLIGLHDSEKEFLKKTCFFLSFGVY